MHWEELYNEKSYPGKCHALGGVTHWEELHIGGVTHWEDLQIERGYVLGRVTNLNLERATY